MTQMPLPSDKIFTVSELNGIIKEILEGFPVITLEGEISNYRPNSSGHLYFNLKDNSSIISAVMFRGAAYSLSFAPKDGMKVQVTGKLSVYGPQGKYQIIISKMSIAGEGDILRMIEERKRKLAAEGLFDQTKKKKLPAFPKTIGIVTSPTGAALRDILQITKRRNKCISVNIFPALVQGTDAAATIAQQINTANAFNLCDVLIVGRGGGSLEDLLPFSEECVVRAIAESHIPVVSAVGHEIDWALSDYAADLRAPTPSAAAEIVVPQLSEIKTILLQYSNELYENSMNRVEKIKLMIKSFKPENLEMQFRSIEQPLLQRFDNAKEGLFQNIIQKLRDTRQYIENCETVLENASPQTIFNRGYSMVRNKNSGEIVRSTENIQEGTELEIVPASGKITATVTSIS
ncbi:MAG: exodeoxyribonuclease VII large subunit [Treponema sp.]|nr:exodeoxyribonuclease VII large subunit [Spirochaetia bacterium]MDY4768805.1 exodeoxyribonuclease VII large subunit [Treponema sp.]